MEHRERAGQSPGTDGRRVVIFGLEVFAPKNRLQLETMATYGYTYDVYVHDETDTSPGAFSGLERLGHRLHVLPHSAPGVLQSAISAVRGRPHHVEFYTTDPRSMVMPLVARTARVPLVTVERGLISVIDERPSWKRWALAGTYRLSDVVLYKEPHMAPLIRKLAPRAQLEFLPNAVSPSTVTASFAERDIDFLWANRILDDRYCEWLTEFAAARPSGHRKTVVAGLRQETLLTPSERTKQDKVRVTASEDISVLGWIDPHPFMMRSRFFVMAARYVFGNNALLEAMSMGCVPIVSRAPGVEVLVEDGVNGFVCEPTGQSLQNTLTRALGLSEDTWTAMSFSARQTIEERYSSSTLGPALARAYAALSPLG